VIGGVVVIDLREVDQDHIRGRCAAIEHAPAGARVVLMVGALKPDPAGVDILRGRAHRHDIEVWGSAHAVRGWVRALIDGMSLL
jgi:hypothetical protein